MRRFTYKYYITGFYPGYLFKVRDGSKCLKYWHYNLSKWVVIINDITTCDIWFNYTEITKEKAKLEWPAIPDRHL